MTSWWVGKTRDEFDAVAAAEQSRMAYDGHRPVLGHELNPAPEMPKPNMQMTGLYSEAWRRVLPLEQEED